MGEVQGEEKVRRTGLCNLGTRRRTGEGIVLVSTVTESGEHAKVDRAKNRPERNPLFQTTLNSEKLGDGEKAAERVTESRTRGIDNDVGKGDWGGGGGKGRGVGPVQDPMWKRRAEDPATQSGTCPKETVENQHHSTSSERVVEGTGGEKAVSRGG